MSVVAIVSCRFEWAATCRLFPGIEPRRSPYGEWFEARNTIFFQGGWGKTSAAASAQYAMDRWSPELLVNLGTCGGFPGEVEPGEILLVERTVIYDIVERMTGAEEAIAHYATDLDLGWLPDPPPHKVRRAVMVSADRDLDPEEIPDLKTRYGAVAGDWESGSIAWVARRNGVRCLILRGVSDLAGEAYSGNAHVFVDGAAGVMETLIGQLPAWTARFGDTETGRRGDTEK